MKRFILSLLVSLPLLVFSQVTIENGRIDEKGNFEFKDKVTLSSDFTWSITDDIKSLVCEVYEDDTVQVDYLMWDIDDILSDTLVYRYVVHSKDGRKFIIDFLKGGSSVIILNDETLQYSVMEGEGVYYE